MALIFDQELPDQLPNSLPVYDLQRPLVTLDTVVRKARKMGLGGLGLDFRLLRDWALYREGSHELAVHGRSGALRFRNLKKQGTLKDPDRTFDVGDADAEEIARGFALTAELFPDDDEARLEKVTHLREVANEVETGQTVETVQDAGVVFRRHVEGVPVIGRGGHSLINVDVDREVVGAHHIWRGRSKQVRDMEVRGREKALGLLEEIANRSPGDVRVVKADLGYFELGELDEQRQLEPAFVLLYHVQNGEFISKSQAVVLAADGGEFQGHRRERRFARPVGQPPRPRPTS